MRVSISILFLLQLLPALISVGVYRQYFIWPVAAIGFTLFLFWLAATPKLWRRLLALALAVFAAVGSASLLTSLYIQGEGFNDRFFYHFDLNSLTIGLDTYRPLIIGAGSYFLACAVAVWRLPRVLPETGGLSFLRRPRGAVMAALCGLCLFPPAVSAGAHIHAQYKVAQSGETRIKREVREVDVLPLAAPPKNLILIYAESLERLYFDEDLFPGLMAKLGPLRSQALEFTNTHQVEGTGWTIAGLVASQCSLPFNIKYYDGSEPHVALAAIEEPFKDEICLGDILDAYGYETVFMGGAPMYFAGKGKFLEANGFDQTLGFNDLKSELPDSTYRNGWGLYDDSLLEFAMKRVNRLEAKDAPYLLSVLTVDTHQPKGHIPKDCESYAADKDNAILQALHCNDRIIGDFIASLLARPDMENTIIALFSDHLSMQNTASDRLRSKEDERRLTWLVWGADIEPGQSEAAATHFDVTPTLLEYMGLPNYRENNWGRSVASGQDGYWFSQKESVRAAAKNVSYLDMEGNSARDGIRIDAATKTVFIEDKAFLATRAGYSMNETIFMLLLDHNGVVDSILFAEDLEQFNRVAKDYTVIAVSRDKAIAPDAVLKTPAPLPPTQDRNAGQEKDKKPSAEEDNVIEPLYYYVGTPSKGYSKQGVFARDLVIPKSVMRRALKQKKLR